MPRFDKEKILRLVSQLRKSSGRLLSLAALERKDFLADQDKIGSSKYHFIVAIESCIDICNHVISQNGYRVPEDYGDTFRAMAEAGALDPDFAEELRNMAKFRNRLVHLYWEIDDSQIYEILQTRLEDFKLFLDAMARFLGWDS